MLQLQIPTASSHNDDGADVNTTLWATASTSEEGGSRTRETSRARTEKKKPVADLLALMLRDNKVKEAEVSKKVN